MIYVPICHLFPVPDSTQLLQRFSFLCSSKPDLKGNVKQSSKPDLKGNVKQSSNPDLKCNVKQHSAHWFCNLSAAFFWLWIHNLHLLKLIFVPIKAADFESSGHIVFTDWLSSTLQSPLSIQLIFC